MKSLIGQFVRFCAVGVTNTAIDFSAYLLLTRVFGIFYLVANILAFCLSASNSYFLNRLFTFKSRNANKPLEFSKFISVLLAGLGVSELILYFCVDWLGLPDVLGKALAISAVLFWNFFGSKLLVFRSSPLSQEDA